MFIPVRILPRTALLALLASASLSSAAANAQSAPPSAEHLYVTALVAMRAAPQPAFATFTTDVGATGMKIAIVPVKRPSGDFAALALGWGSGMATNTSWDTVHRSADDRTIVIKDRRKLIVLSPMYDPLWQGAYTWLRYGFRGEPPSSPGNADAATPAPLQPSPAASDVPAIGGVVAMYPASYVVMDAGDASCPNGVAGRRLHLVARSDPETHPLTDVVVDPAANRFCSMRFNMGRASLVSLTGSFELHFGQVAGYWLTTDGTADILIRFGFGVKRAHLTFAYSNFTFPPTIPDERFTAG
jgi:hypothetical protein